MPRCAATGRCLRSTTTRCPGQGSGRRCPWWPARPAPDVFMVAAGPRLAVLLEQCLGPVPGGTGRYARELGGALVSTAPAGASVAVWTAWHRDVSAALVPGASG